MGNGKGGVEGGEVDCCSGATEWGGWLRNSHRRGRVECWVLAVEVASAFVVFFGHGMRFGMRRVQR